MSMRQHVGRQDIEYFLTEVGRTRQAGRLYLTGGAALVHRGIRLGQTLDIDIQITIDPGNLTAQVAQLKQKMNINIEFGQYPDFCVCAVFHGAHTKIGILSINGVFRSELDRFVRQPGQGIQQHLCILVDRPKGVPSIGS